MIWFPFQQATGNKFKSQKKHILSYIHVIDIKKKINKQFKRQQITKDCRHLI